MQERKKAKEEIAELKREASKELICTRAAADQRVEEFSETLREQVSLPLSIWLVLWRHTVWL